MLRRTFILLLSLCAALSLRADDFADATTAFDAGKYEDARRGFERVIGKGASANTYYNLGNSYFRMGDMGAAALAYERALMVNPSLGEAFSNLKLVREKTRARIEDEKWMEKIFLSLRSEFARSVMIASAWIGWVLIFTGFSRRRAFSWIFGIFFLASSGVFHWGLEQSYAKKWRLALIVADGVEAREQPADRARTLETLPMASRVNILSEQGEWLYCELPAGKNGWLKVGQATRILPPAGA